MILTQYQVWPMAGGILDQDPLFLVRLQTYTAAKAQAEERKKAEEKRKAKRPRMRGR